jgi:hypothetical protein
MKNIKMVCNERCSNIISYNRKYKTRNTRYGLYLVISLFIYCNAEAYYNPTNVAHNAYTVSEITQDVYNTAKSQNSNAPVFKLIDTNGSTTYYKWSFANITNLDGISFTDNSNGGMEYYVVNDSGNVTTGTYFYANNTLGTQCNASNYAQCILDPQTFMGLNASNGAAINGVYDVQGGIYGVFINNEVTQSGGAVYGSTFLNVDGWFLSNYAQSGGGAIAVSNISSINGAFVNNHTDTTGAEAGGALYINGSEGDINGHYINNGSCTGGAIWISSSSNNNQITGDFIANSASGTGGAIANFGNTSVTGNFILNDAQTNGGAIYNSGGNLALNGYFIENHAENGGAIYNKSSGASFDNGVINLSGAIFSGNSATTGGAIYNADTGIINISGDVLFQESSDSVYNDGTINLIVTGYNGTHVTFQDITGNGTLNIQATDNDYVGVHISANSIIQNLLNIENGATLQIDPSKLNQITSVNNDGTLVLTSGILSKNIVGSGSILINGSNVTSNVLINQPINLRDPEEVASLSINASNIGNTVTMVWSPTLILTGGTLNNTVSGSGNIIIDGDVISNVNLYLPNVYNSDTGTTLYSYLTINQNKSLQINANNINANVVNNGTLYLTGGALTNFYGNVTGTGTIVTIGNVYGLANRFGNNINNDYDLTLSGGTLSTDISGDGNLVINGNVTVVDGVSIANDININQEKQLSISASSIGSNVINSGTLSLTGGNLNHQITGNGVINITDYTYTSANNLLGTGNISNTSTLELTGGILQQVVSGNGNIVINGDVYSSASNLLNNTIIADENTLTLTGGTLQKNISASGNGNIVINGDVSTQADNLLANTALNDDTILTLNGGTLSTQIAGTGTLAINNNYSVLSSANNIGVDVNNNGYLTFSGGTLSNNVTGSGQIIIDGTVINEALISQTMVVNSGKSLTTAASGIGANISNNGNVTVTGGTVNYNITGDGTVTIDGNVENNGNLGLVAINENKSLTTSADSIYGISSNNGSLYLNGGTLGYVVSGNVYITGNVINTASQWQSINISNGGTFTTSANLLTNNNAISNSGTLNITGGNLQQNVTGGDTIIAQNATTSATSFGNLELNGIMNIGTNMVNIANADINGTINLGISALNKNSSAYTGGHIIANDITFGDDAILNLTITDTNLQKGDSSGGIEIITANGEWTGDIATFTSNNLYDIAYNTENHTFTFTRKKFSADLITELNGTELDVNIAGVWDELQSSDNPNIQSIINAIDYNSQHNATKYAKLIHNLAPQNHQVTLGAVRNTNTVINNHIFTRLATLRRQQINNLRKRRNNPFYYYGTYNGRNGGDTEPTTNNGVWVEGLYNYAQQKDDTKFSGNTFGVMGGFDSKLTEHLNAGLGYAFNKTNIDADNHDIDATGHTGFVYAEYKPTQWYLDALLSYNLTNYQNSSALVDNLSVKSDYKTNSLSGALTSGYDFQKGLDLYGGLNYIGIKQDTYTDTAGQYVKADDTKMLTLKAGGRYKLTSQKIKRASTVLKAAVLYDVMSDDGVATVTVGNNNYIIHGNGLDPFGVQAGIMFDSFGDNTYMSIGYDLEWRNNFISHTGYIKLKYNF